MGECLIFNSKGISVLFLVIAMMLMVSIGYVLSYLIPTKQKSVSLTVSSNQAFFLAQSGVEFAVRYATVQGWTTKPSLNGLDNMTKILGRGSFILDYDEPNDRLISRGQIPNSSERRIVISSFTSFLITKQLVLSSPPVPCLRASQQVEFSVRNSGTGNVTLDSFSATWTQGAPLRRINTIRLGGTLKFDGFPDYATGEAQRSFDVGNPPTYSYTIPAGQTIQVVVGFNFPISNPGNMIITFYYGATESYIINLGSGTMPSCP